MSNDHCEQHPKRLATYLSFRGTRMCDECGYHCEARLSLETGGLQLIVVHVVRDYMAHAAQLDGPGVERALRAEGERAKVRQLPAVARASAVRCMALMLRSVELGDAR